MDGSKHARIAVGVLVEGGASDQDLRTPAGRSAAHVHPAPYPDDWDSRRRPAPQEWNLAVAIGEEADQPLAGPIEWREDKRQAPAVQRGSGLVRSAGVRDSTVARRREAHLAVRTAPRGQHGPSGGHEPVHCHVRKPSLATAAIPVDLHGRPRGSQPPDPVRVALRDPSAHRVAAVVVYQNKVNFGVKRWGGKVAEAGPRRSGLRIPTPPRDTTSHLRAGGSRPCRSGRSLRPGPGWVGSSNLKAA